MPSKLVHIVGTMTWEEGAGGGGTGIWGPTDPRPGYGLPGPPPGIWGGGQVPMPTPPIHLGPGGEVGGPPGFWGPNDPRPGWGLPGLPPGIWGPTDPRPGWGLPGGGPPTPPGGGSAGQLPASDPSGSQWVYAFVPGYGWMWAVVPKPAAENPAPPTEE